MYDLFVSHNRKDKEWVRNFVSFLRFSGLTVFFDEDNIRFGADISTSISNAIENSRHVVLVLSSNSVKSDWVALEYAISLYSDPAAKEEKIIPIKLENIENTQIPLALRRLRFVDLTDGAEYSTRQLRALLNQLGVNDSNAIGIPSRISGSESRNSKYFFSTGRHPNIDETSASKFTRHYANLFRIRDVEIPYIPVFGGWEGGINEFTIGEICCFTDSEYIYSAPAEISSYADSEYEPLHGEELPNSVRLQGYNWLVGNQDVRKVPTFHFARVKYGDYRKISVILDKAIPFSNCTFRDKYAPTIEHQISESKLSNICGVGIFVITRDNQIVITRQSKNVTVYPEVWGYSASGAMDWMDNVDPFREIERESIEEISHKIDLENTILFRLMRRTV